MAYFEVGLQFHISAWCRSTPKWFTPSSP